MGKKDWWHPDELKEAQNKILKADSLESLDPGTDFGSYRLMLKTGDMKSSELESHNNINPAYLPKKVKSILGNYLPYILIDIGCGMGFTTNELKKSFPKSKVIGIDISYDAIAFAKNKFIDCEFLVEAIDPRDLKIRKADLICAFEFYPFTRTALIEDHKNYLNYLLGWLNDGGKLLICQRWDNEESLSVNYDELVNDLSEWKFTSYPMPLQRVYKIVKNLLFAELLTKFLMFLGIRKFERTKLLLIEKKGNSFNLKQDKV